MSDPRYDLCFSDPVIPVHPMEIRVFDPGDESDDSDVSEALTHPSLNSVLS